MLSLYDLLWEVGVLQCPETQQTFLQLFSAINIEFPIRYCYKIRISSIYVNATDLSTLCNIAFKSEQRFERYNVLVLLLFFIFTFFVLFLLFFFFILVFQLEQWLLLIFFFLFYHSFLMFITQVSLWIVLIEYMLLMILGLSKQPLNDSDCLKHGIRKFHLYILYILRDCTIITSICLRTNCISLCLAHRGGTQFITILRLVSRLLESRL